MVNVENNAEESGEVEVIEEMNPLNRFKYSDDEFAAYLKSNAIPGEDPNTRPAIVDYVKDVDKPSITNYKSLFFSWKNAGKTRMLRTMAKCNLKNPLVKKVDYNHLRFLMENKYIDEIYHVEGLDGEGKGDVNKEKFDGIGFRNRPMFYEGGPMPTMQDPVAFVREFMLFLKANKWARAHPDLYKEKTGLDAPDASAFENYSVLATQIMDYVRTISHDDKIDKLEAKGQQLGAPMIKKFDNWDIRNSNWDYIGGYIQNAFPMAYSATARARKKWVNSEPTDDDDVALYSAASYAFNIVCFLYREDNEQTRERNFYAQIISSDFMEPGTMYPIIENPDYFKVIAEISKYSHRKILDKFGTWKDVKIKNKKGEVVRIVNAWVENKPVTTSNSSSASALGQKPGPVATEQVKGESPGRGSNQTSDNEKVETAQEPQLPKKKVVKRKKIVVIPEEQSSSNEVLGDDN